MAKGNKGGKMIVTKVLVNQCIVEHQNNQISLPASTGFLENNFDNFPAVVTKQEVNINETNNIRGIQRIDDQGQFTGLPSTSALSETAYLQQYAAIQEPASVTVENSLKQENQNDYMQFSYIDPQIKRELLNDQNNLSSITPSFGFSRVNTVKTTINPKISRPKDQVIDGIVNVSSTSSPNSYPSNSMSPALSLSTMNSNTNGRFSAENLNAHVTNIHTTTPPVLKSETSMAGSQICKSEVPNAIPLPYFKGFISKWQIPIDDTGAVNGNLDDDLFTEMAFFLRGEKHKPKREDNSFDFCKRTMFENIHTEDLHMDDRTFLYSLYRDEPPKNVETPISYVQNNKDPEIKADVYSIFNVNNNIIKAEPDCNISALKIKNDETVKINDQPIETPEIECENLNNFIDSEREEPVTFNKEEALLSKVQNAQNFLQGLSTQALQDIIKNAFSNTKTPSSNVEPNSLADPCVATNNLMHSELDSSITLPDSSSKEIPITVIDSCVDSDNSVGDEGRCRNSDDSEAILKNSSVDRELIPKISPKENQKSENKSSEFGKNKKGHCEIILEKEEQGKALRIANSNLKGKNKYHSQKSKSTSSFMSAKHYDQSTVIATQRNSLDSRERKLPSSRNKANINEKGKPTCNCKVAKMFASDKRKDTDLSSHRLKNRANEMENDKRSNVSNFVEMGVDNHFKNRNSSLFQNVTKCPQQPIACRNKQGCYTKTSHAVPSQASMEEVHGQIETSISVPPAKKKLSYRDYLSRKASDPTPPLHLDKDLLRNSTRTLLPTPRPRTNYPVQDPRRGRTQTFNHGELMYISGYQPTVPMQTIADSHQSVSSLRLATWNSFSSNKADASSPMGPIMNSNFLPHSSDTPASTLLVPPASQTPTSDDMDLCSPEPFAQHASSSYFHSSHGVQQFGSSTSFAPSQPQGQRLAVSSPHPNIPSMFPPRNHLSLHSRYNGP